jgi:hypothetical protein
MMKKKWLVGFIIIISIIGTILVSQIRIPGLHVTYDVFVDGNYAYLTNNDGCIIIDIETCNRVGKINIGTGFGISVKSDLVFVGSGNTLFIYNISFPENPVKISEWHCLETINNLFIEESYAYLSFHGGGFGIVNISNPFSPSAVSRFNDTGRGLGIWVYQPIVFLADPDNGLDIINITDH